MDTKPETPEEKIFWIRNTNIGRNSHSSAYYAAILKICKERNICPPNVYIASKKKGVHGTH
jgi:hypothetical protein